MVNFQIVKYHILFINYHYTKANLIENKTINILKTKNILKKFLYKLKIFMLENYKTVKLTHGQ